MKLKYWVLILVSSFFIMNVSANETDVLTSKLIELRSQVDELSQKLETAKEEKNAEFKALSSRRNQLESEIEAASVKKKLNEDRLAVIKKELSNKVLDKELLTPSLELIFNQLSQYINNSIPFQTSKRETELNKIKEEYESGILPPAKCVGKLWAFVEDELRLTRENGIHKFVINLNGEEKLATIAKLGMMAMYFQSGEFEYGMVTKTNDHYSFIKTEDKNAKHEIMTLIDGMKKQIRVGRYEIPNSFTKEEISL